MDFVIALYIYNHIYLRRPLPFYAEDARITHSIAYRLLAHSVQ